MSFPYRIPAVALAVSAAVGFGAYVGYEGYSDTAKPPIAGDVPTYGFGTTRDAAGNLLKGGEKIAPPQAVKLALRDVAVHEERLKKCLIGIDLAQNEFDAYVSLELNTGAVCASSIPGKLRAGDYAAACKTILDFDGYCTKPKIRNAAGKAVCPPGAMKKLPGLTKRRQAEYRMCLGEL
ncbi:MAG: lysozyme [Proteobacteria bacterium]|nr:lysozyme [Pseudomonadota bacterium]